MSHVLFVLLSLLVLVGCQVEEKSGNGQLIAGHVPSTNSFTVSAPSNGTYTVGNVLNFTLSFPYNVDISGGTPSLSLNIGGSTVSAPLASGAGTKNLVFSYTVLGTQNDTDGIVLNSLALNGATMTFTSNAVTTNCDIATVTSRIYSNILVDNTGPTMTGFALITPPGFYNVGETITFAATYSEPVVVGTPAPTIGLTFNTAATATYVSGSGTSTINFQYTITSTQFDVNGYAFSSTNITVPGGSYIRDASGNAAALSFAAYSAAIDGAGTGVTCTNGTSDCVEFDGRAPYIVNITPPTPGTYLVSQNIDYVIEFNQNVTVASVSPLPSLALTIGSTTRNAYYSSGSGTRFLTFRYTTVPGDVDSNGITSPTSITLNTAEITATTGGAEFLITGTGGGGYTNNSFTAPDTSSVIIAATQPQPTAVLRGADTTNRIFPTAIADNIWIIDQPLIITVEFNTGMTVGQVGGTPYIPLTIGSNTRNATYLSGGDGQTALTFRYVIQEGDEDLDGIIQLGSIQLNGGTITDSVNTNSLLALPVASVSSTTVDGIRPTISTVTPPADGTYSTLTTPSNLSFITNWSEAVDFSGVINLPLTIGATAVNAATITGNDTAAVTISTSSLATYNDTDGITVSSPLTGAGTIRDQAGNTANVLTFPVPNTTNVFVDTTAPTVVSVTPPANGTYTLGQALDFDLTFSESVTVNVAGGYPRIPFIVGATTRYLVPTSNGSGLTHTFRYTIVAGESDTNGIAFGAGTAAINHTATGFARDAGLNNATANFFGVIPSTTGILVDSLGPTISSTVRPVNGTYQTGDTLQFTVNWSENVNYNGVGTNRIAATLDNGTTVYFDYVSGSGTSTYIYEYTIAANDLDLTGITPNISTVTIAGGAVLEDTYNNAATLTFTAQNLSNVFIVYSDIAIVANAPFTTNRAFGATPSISQVGGVVVANYKIFDGDDTVSTTGTISGIEHIFVVLRTDATPANMPFISSFTVLEDDAGGGFNLRLNGNVIQNIPASTMRRVYIDTSGSPETINPGEIITNAFLGEVAEIIIVNGPLNGTQIGHINSYLSTKYP